MAAAFLLREMISCFLHSPSLVTEMTFHLTGVHRGNEKNSIVLKSSDLAGDTGLKAGLVLLWIYWMETPARISHNKVLRCPLHIQSMWSFSLLGVPKLSFWHKMALDLHSPPCDPHLLPGESSCPMICC